MAANAGPPRQHRRPRTPADLRGRRRPKPHPDPARLAAYDLLRVVAEQDAYANLVLPGLLRERRLDSRDAAFATELGYGTLRRSGTLDVILAACSSRPLAEIDPPLVDVLRLGAYQLLHTRVPTHAAVSATVELARATVGEGRSSFANAVLRRVAAQDLDGWLAQVGPAPAADPVAALALRAAYPAWIVRAMQDALGGDLAETAALLAEDRPAVHLTARPGRIGRDELLRDVGAAGAAGPWSPYAVRLAEGDPGSVRAVRDGRAAVQDEGSQLAALALTRAELTGPDSRWLDMCAGPGGKAALLAGVVAGRGGSLLAADLTAHRAAMVRRTLTGGPGATLTVTADSTVPGWQLGSFDRVLLDAPCTGLGALRRRPEARWRRQPADVPRLAALQGQLLRSAADALRPGGLVAYVTCSPHLAETRVVVADALRKRPDLEQLDARGCFPGVPDLGAGPHVQLWPHRHGTDAMFVALLRRAP